MKFGPNPRWWGARLALAITISTAIAVPSAIGAQLTAGLDSVFYAGIAAFDAEDYKGAALLLSSVYSTAPDHALAAPSMVMAAKAHYRNGKFTDCLTVLDAMEGAYPTSPYYSDIHQLRQYAQTEIQRAQLSERAVRLGVVLPMSRGSVELTQTLLSGIRVAVEDYNREGIRPIQILFRDTQNSSDGAYQAVMQLASAGAQAIIGPLFSEEADGAAKAAELAKLVLVAPLATAADLTLGRRFAFQANPTIALRGQFLAEHGLRGQGLERFGIIADASAPSSIESAEAFKVQAEQLGVEIGFVHHLTSPAEWGRFTSAVGSDALGNIDGVFLAVHATRDVDARIRAEASLREIRRASDVTYVLGSEAFIHVNWAQQPQDLEVSYVATYDYDGNESDALTFAHHLAQWGMKPGRLSVVGYDIARMVLDKLFEKPNVSLVAKLEHASPYNGIGSTFHFAGEQRNKAMYLFRASPRGGYRVK